MRGRDGSMLSLASFNPEAERRPGAERAALVLLPPAAAVTAARARQGVPARRVNLAFAIETHLAGRDGLTEPEFVTLFAGGRIS
jgi:hypothetical protein